MRSIELKSKYGAISVGNNNPIIVNCNVGINTPESYKNELVKIDSLFKNSDTSPDTMMDLSICKLQSPIWSYIISNYDVPVGLVPAYTSFVAHKGINKSELLESIEMSADAGVAFMTMHFAADEDLYSIAKNDRLIPTTSRGGIATLLDCKLNKRCSNIFIDNIDEIIVLAKKYDFVINIGATFRPAGILDACDSAHIAETIRQKEICSYIQDRNVSVVVENVGHIDMHKIEEHSVLLQSLNAPIMPLGPTIIDSAIGNDEISAAIGAAFMGYQKCAHIINAISPNEHLTSIFSASDLQQGVRAAKIAARAVNVCNFPEIKQADNNIYRNRAIQNCCLNSEGKDCYRCDYLCPLKITL